MPRTGQLARYFGTIHTIYSGLTILPFLVGNQVPEIMKATSPMTHGLTWRRRIERFTIGDLEDCLYRTPSTRVALLSQAALSHPDGLRRKTSIQLDLTHVSKLRSGKADGVSAQHTERRLFEITGTASRHSGPVMPNRNLDPERRILCQRTTAKNTSRKWTSTKPTVLRPCVKPTWYWLGRGV